MTNELENACYYIEKARSELYVAVQKRNREIMQQHKLTGQNNRADYVILPPDDWKAEYDGKMITIYIPDYLPRTAKRNTGSFERWVENTQAALWSLIPCPKFDKAFVYVKIYLPSNGWDVDNRDVKPIINGIARADVIPDDTYDHVAYAVDGGYDETPHTIVHIFSYSIAAEMLPHIM
jgi:hypothetical protein